MTDERDDGATPDDKIVSEAKRRFKRCQDWESDCRRDGVEDKKFAEGDSRNGWQWDEGQRQSRTKDGRPALTINKVRQGCLQIINDQRQNKSQIRVRPVGDGASFEAAEVYEGVIRHIEYASNAMETYDSAAWHQITAGYGAWRVTSEYADDGSLDQELRIRRIKDPNTVYLDPDIEEFDGSDARFGFVYKDLARDRFESEHPQWKDKIPDGTETFVGEDAGWHDKDHVRVSTAAADATNKANAAQNNAIGAAAADATNKANAAQSAATSTAESYAANADASVLSQAVSYAAGQASSALQQAESYAAQGDSNTLSTANSNAQGYANSAQSAAATFASNSDAAYFAQAKSYTNGQVSAAQSSNASTYVQGTRLSGSYTAALAGVQPGSVCIGAGGGSQANYAYLQVNINGTWYTVGNN